MDSNISVIFERKYLHFASLKLGLSTQDYSNRMIRVDKKHTKDMCT
jgi:hypothetical protein